MESIRQMMIGEDVRVVLSVANIGLLIAVVWTFAKVYFSFKSDSDKKDIEIKELNTKLSNQDNRIASQDRKIVKLEDKHNLTELTIAVLKTKLDNIEVGIAEIKAILKDKK